MKDKKTVNFIRATIPAKSANEAFSRSLICSFASQLDPTLEELCDVKTAISEAVTNCIVHAYAREEDTSKKLIYLYASITSDGCLTVKIKDKGCGIDDIERAMTPLYSGGGEERSGMGFSIMQCFTDSVKVKSQVGKGTTVTLKKYIAQEI